MLFTAVVNNQACHDPGLLTQCFELSNSSNILELLFFDRCLSLVVFISLISRLGLNASMFSPRLVFCLCLVFISSGVL